MMDTIITIKIMDVGVAVAFNIVHLLLSVIPPLKE